MSRAATYRLAAVAVVVLAGLHAGLQLLPAPPFTVAMNVVLFATNLYVLYCAAAILRDRSARTLAVFGRAPPSPRRRPSSPATSRCGR